MGFLFFIHNLHTVYSSEIENILGQLINQVSSYYIMLHDNYLSKLNYVQKCVFSQPSSISSPHQQNMKLDLNVSSCTLEEWHDRTC